MRVATTGLYPGTSSILFPLCPSFSPPFFLFHFSFFFKEVGREGGRECSAVFSEKDLSSFGRLVRTMMPGHGGDPADDWELFVSSVGWISSLAEKRAREFIDGNKII